MAVLPVAARLIARIAAVVDGIVVLVPAASPLVRAAHVRARTPVVTRRTSAHDRTARIPIRVVVLIPAAGARPNVAALTQRPVVGITDAAGVRLANAATVVIIPSVVERAAIVLDAHTTREEVIIDVAGLADHGRRRSRILHAVFCNRIVVRSGRAAIGLSLNAISERMVVIVSRRTKVRIRRRQRRPTRRRRQRLRIRLWHGRHVRIHLKQELLRGRHAHVVDRGHHEL